MPKVQTEGKARGEQPSFKLTGSDGWVLTDEQGGNPTSFLARVVCYGSLHLATWNLPTGDAHTKRTRAPHGRSLM